MLSAKLDKLVEEFKPDAVVCTHAFPVGILSVLKSRGKLAVPLVGVITDYTVHPFWIHEYVDTYFIPAEDLKYQLMDMGIRESAIKPLGIPVRKEFRENPGKKEVRAKLGLADRTTILLMGGGLGLGDMKYTSTSLGIVTRTCRSSVLQEKMTGCGLPWN